MFDSFLTLVVLLVVLGVTAWALLGRRETTQRRRRTSTYRRRSPWRTRIPVLFVLGALVFLGLGFTQFRFLHERASTGSVVLTMDASESMDRTDVVPSRIEAAQAAARVFLENLPADLQVGLVSFAATADVLVAPTFDRNALSDALAALPRGEGTVIGDGLAASLDAIQAEWDRNGTGPAAVVLLSDGRDTGSATTPDEAAVRAAEMKVPVYTVVLRAATSGEGGANAALLQRVADTSGGASYTATTAGSLIDVYQTLQTKLSTELAISDYGALFVGISAFFAIAATVAILFALRSED